MVSFGDPDRLWLLAACLAAALVAVLRHRRRLGFQRQLASPAVWRRVMGGVPATGLARMLLWVLAASLLVVSLARPRWGQREATEVVVTRDLVFAIDVSASMVCPDLRPSRLTFALDELRRLLPQLVGNRIGVVVFSGEAYPLLPLTADLEAVGLFLSEVRSGMVVRGGTDLERGIGAALGLLPAEGLGRVIVLVTDGEGLEGEPEVAAAAARDAGVGMLALLAGTAAGGPIPLPDEHGHIKYKVRATGQPVMTRADREAVSTLVAETGGEVFDLVQPGAAARLVEAVTRLRSREVESRSAALPIERFPALLSASAALLILGFVAWPWRRCALACVILLALPGLSLADEAASAAAPAGASRSLPKALAEVPKAVPPLWQRLVPGGGRRLARSGLQHWREGDLDLAIRDFRWAALIDGEDPDWLFNLGSALAVVGDFKEAVPLLIEAHVGGSGDAAFNLGTAALIHNDAELAVKWLRTAILADPENGDARRNYELALLLQAVRRRARLAAEGAVSKSAVEAGLAPPGPGEVAAKAVNSNELSPLSPVYAALERAEAQARRAMLDQLPQQVAPAGRDW